MENRRKTKGNFYGEYFNEVKKVQRHTTNENQICIWIYLIRTNILICKTDLHQGNTLMVNFAAYSWSNYYQLKLQKFTRSW